MKSGEEAIRTDGLPGNGASISPSTERREVESAALLAGGRELLIRHGGEVYTLRQTSKGKLILTK